MSKIIDMLEELINDYRMLERQLGFARFHILNNIDCFTDKDKQCMVFDGVLFQKEIKK